MNVIHETRRVLASADQAGCGDVMRQARARQVDTIVAVSGRVYGARFAPDTPPGQKGYVMLVPETAEEWLQLELRAALMVAAGARVQCTE